MLDVRHLNVRLDNKDIVEDLNFELEEGDSLSIIGPNGSGKTVLLKALLNLVRYSGEISWGPDVRIGYVPQKIDANRGLPITFENLFASKQDLVGAARSEVEAIWREVGLKQDMLKTAIGDLSGGEFQRGLIAFALIGKPNVILFDEPTASIDRPGEEHVYNLIHALHDEHQLTVIIVSHDLSFVYRYATKVLCLNRRGVCFGPPRQALTPDVLDRLYGDAMGHYRHTH